MNDQIQQRLIHLRAEFENGRQQLDRLDAKRREVQRTLLRISGAIQVLEEVLAEGASDAPERAAEPASLRAVGS